MIVVTEKTTTEIKGTFKTRGFTIKPTKEAFKMWASGVYVHKVRAVIRELACNAVDAHTTSRVDRPHKIHLPTQLEPWFAVRDFGAGLSPQEMEEVYLVVFNSTKQDSNELIGSFGIGRLSFYAIADSAIVHSYQNGVKASYSLFTDEDGLPAMAELCSVDTDEPNGLEVVVATNRIDEFRSEAVNVFQHFKSLPTINLSDVVTRIEEAKASYKFVGEGFALNSGYKPIKAIMGNVAYEVPSNYSIGCEGYVEFAIGELAINPGREHLSLDDATKAALTKRLNEVKSGIATLIEAEIDTLPTAFKKAVRFKELNVGTIGNIIGKLESKYRLPKPISHIIGWIKRGSNTSKFEYESLPLGDVSYFRDLPNFTARIRQEVKYCCKKIVILTEDQIRETQIDLDVIEDLNTLPKVERVKSDYHRVKVLQTTFGSDWTIADLDINEEYIYVNIMRRKATDYQYRSLSGLLEAARNLGVDIPKVYGLTTAVKKIGEGIEFSQFLKKHINPPALALLSAPAYGRILSLVDDRFKQKELESNHVSLYNQLGMNIVHNDYLDLLSEEYLKAFPMIKWVPAYEIGNAITDIKSYVSKLS